MNDSCISTVFEIFTKMLIIFTGDVDKNNYLKSLLLPLLVSGNCLYVLISAKTPIVYSADSWTILWCQILMFVEKLAENQTII
jgi:hypothetical protein